MNSQFSTTLLVAIRALERHYNGSDMAAGDAQRVWFQEMIERLCSQWHQSMSFDAIVELRDDLDATLQRLRSQRHNPDLATPRLAFRFAA